MKKADKRVLMEALEGMPNEVVRGFGGALARSLADGVLRKFNLKVDAASYLRCVDEVLRARAKN